jgi:hypothetical protein
MFPRRPRVSLNRPEDGATKMAISLSYLDPIFVYFP